MTSLATSELRDFHASRFAQAAALREMLVDAAPSRDRRHADLLSGLMRDAVTEILRLQQMISRLDR